eukprot:9494319-Pyramimonas_sp.AAC.1
MAVQRTHSNNGCARAFANAKGNRGCHNVVITCYRTGIARACRNRWNALARVLSHGSLATYGET